MFLPLLTDVIHFSGHNLDVSSITVSDLDMPTWIVYGAYVSLF